MSRFPSAVKGEKNVWKWESFEQKVSSQLCTARRFPQLGWADRVCPPERMAGPDFGKKLSWSRENEVWLALSVREE